MQHKISNRTKPLTIETWVIVLLAIAFSSVACVAACIDVDTENKKK